MLINKASRAAEIVALNEAASPAFAGKAVAHFAQKYDEFVAERGAAAVLLNFPFGSSNVLINASGNRLHYPTKVKGSDDSDYSSRVAAYKEALSRTGWSAGFEPAVVSGAAPTNKMIGDVRIPAGLCLLVGGAAAGKTPLAHALAGFGDRDYHVVRYGEPLSGYITNEDDAAFHVAKALLSKHDVVLDSVKDVLSLMGGAAMKSGLSREVLPLFSRWATIAADIGVTLYVPVNPSSPDDEVISLLVEATKSNATMTIYSDGGDKWSFVARRGEGLQRESGALTARYLPDGTVEIRNGATSALSTKEYSSTSFTGEDISDAAFSASLRRSVAASVE
jgi:hypothetical protein